MNKEEYEFIIKDLKTDIQSLKQELTEKDKEIERLKTVKNQSYADRKREIKEKNKIIADLNSDLNWYVSEFNKSLATIGELRNQKETPQLRMELLQRRHQNDVEDKKKILEQNEILDKALKLACEEIKIAMDIIIDKTGVPRIPAELRVKDYCYFIEQAKGKKDE